MSLMESFREELVKQILYYTQEEGLRDNETAERIGCSRATVNRIRKQYSIPTANLRNRKDKLFICPSCDKAYYIRRKERRKRTCEDCTSLQD